jgi:hypothetical protein
MGSFSDYWENTILDHVFGKGSYLPPTIFVGLSTSNPGEDGSGLNEPSGNNYARVQTAASDWSSASNGALANADMIDFNEATGSWGTLTHFALFDAASTGHFVAYGSLITSKAIGSGDTARFNAGDLVVTLD